MKSINKYFISCLIIWFISSFCRKCFKIMFIQYLEIISRRDDLEIKNLICMCFLFIQCIIILHHLFIISNNLSHKSMSQKISENKRRNRKCNLGSFCKVETNLLSACRRCVPSLFIYTFNNTFNYFLMLRTNTVSIVVRKMRCYLAQSVIKKIPTEDLMDHAIFRFSCNTLFICHTL